VTSKVLILHHILPQRKQMFRKGHKVTSEVFSPNFDFGTNADLPRRFVYVANDLKRIGVKSLVKFSWAIFLH